MDINVLIRFFAFIITISTAVLFYQFFVDITFLNIAHWVRLQRVKGLANGANVYAFNAFLLLPLFIFGSFFETKKIMKAFYIITIISLLIGMIYSGNRTGIAGVFLLSISSPIILAMVYKQWHGRIRLILFLVPFVLIIGTYLVLPSVVEHVQITDMGVLANRLVSTWHKFEEGGLEGLFFYKEARGTLFFIAWALLMKSPLAGWGPGGFYREFPNEFYIQSGNIFHAFDSALNHYLMIGGDLGLPSLVINLFLILSPLIIAIFTLRKLSNLKQRFIVSILFVTNFIFLIMIITIPPSYAPDLLWIWTSELAYLTVIGEKNGILLKLTSKNWKISFYFLTTIAFLLVISGSFQTTFGSKGYLARQEADWWPLKYEKNFGRLDIPVVGDFNGDGAAEIGVFRSGHWYLDINGNYEWDGPGVDSHIIFGMAGDIPIAGDWNGTNGRDCIGVFRAGRMILDMNCNGQWDVGIDWSVPLRVSSRPVVGDWNGDGATKIGAFRNGHFYLDMNGNGMWDDTPTDSHIIFGIAGDIPIAGDWDGTNGRDCIGVFREGRMILDMNCNGQWDTGIDQNFAYGLSTDIPVVGDFNGDGVTEIGVFRNGHWYLDMNGNRALDSCSTDGCYTFGTTGDSPAVGTR